MTREQIIDWLDSYVELDSERAGILELIADLEEERAGSQLHSPKLDGMPRSGTVSDPTATSAARFAALVEHYEEASAALYDRMKEIEEAINAVEKPDQRDMLRAHYLKGLKWPEIAKKKNYSISSCTAKASAGITAIYEAMETL